MPKLYDSPSQMEPMLLRDKPALTELALELVHAGGELSAKMHPLTQAALSGLIRNMNSYYSNLIEGHRTSPLDIERALNKKFSSDPKKRALQFESKAHVEVEALIDRRISADPQLNVSDASFLCWIHAEFYRRMPPEFCVVGSNSGKELQVEPGQLRKADVAVGDHVPPAFQSLPAFMDRFSEVYRPSCLDQVQRIIAAAAAHHRLTWIHPFLDGNGRVARLFTHAYFAYTRVNARGLWTLSRGLARNRAKYMQQLAFADMPRMGDLDGRGHLSEKALVEFSSFFLSVAIDQIRFMIRVLDINNLRENIEIHLKKRGLKSKLSVLLIELLRSGEMPRGPAAGVLGLRPSQGRIYLATLLKEGLIVSDTPKGPLRLAFPASAAIDYFPKLYLGSSGDDEPSTTTS